MRVPSSAPEYRERRRFAPRVALVIVAALIIVGFFSARGLAVFYTDKLWFDDLGFGGTWRTLLVAKIVPALIFTAVMFALMLASLIVADRFAPKFRNMGPEDEVIERYRNYITPYAGRIRVGIAFVFAMLVGVGASSQWRTWILFRNSVTWGVKDPQFHKDIGFYVFELPFLRFIFDWLFVVLVVVLVVTAVFHYLNGGIRFQAPYARVTPQVKAHLSVILALMAFTKTAQYYLGKYELVFSHRGAVDGATYTDVKAQLPALNFLVLISIVGGILFLANIWRRGFTLPIIAVGLWAFVSIVLGTAYPAYVQRFTVQPAERSSERPYISRNITATRAAYGLDEIVTRQFAAATDLDRAKVDQTANAATLSNVRLWDPASLLETVQANQGFKSYYKFATPSIDRYKVGTTAEQTVLLSLRELNGDGLPSTTWLNQHLAYTHGLGGVVVEANGASRTNDPNYLVSGLPPRGDGDLRMGQTDVYFGQGVASYAVVNSKEGEVEVGSNSRETTDHYKGNRGVEASSFLRKAALALRFGDFNLVVSDRITDQSRVLFIRDVRDRVAKAAPFLRFDRDPYPVILADGHVVWIIDAYTTTGRYPYSQSLRAGDVSSGLGADINYARNSVKAVVDAYDGSVKFYVVDESDPMIRAYRKAFPDLFTDQSKIPADLAKHFRYPEDLFKVQTRMFEQYHVLDPDVFFKSTEQWAVTPQPSENSSNSGSGSSTAAARGNDGGRSTRLESLGSRVEPLYLTMQLPGERGQEFVLTRSFVPVSQNSAIDNQLSAFIAARSDGYQVDGKGTYGQIVVYQPPPGKVVPSPVKAAQQINSNEDISQQRTLLDQRGSALVFGSIQLVPVGDAIVYAQPIYIRSTTRGSFPKVSFIALAYGDKAVIGKSMSEALANLFGAGTSKPPPSDGGGGKGPTDAQAAKLLVKIDAAWTKYQDALKAGKFEDAGKALDELNALFQQYRDLGKAKGSTGSTTTTTTTVSPSSSTSTPATTTTTAAAST